MAGSITAALFIEEFILSPKTPWVHFDTYAWSSGSMISSKGAALQGLDQSLSPDPRALAGYEPLDSLAARFLAS